MANFTLKNQKILLGHIHITTRLNSVALSQAQAALDDTVFGQDTMSNMPGLRSIACSVAGLYDPDTEYDGTLSSQLGLAGRPFTLADSTTVTSLAYFFNSMLSEYSPFQNRVGELAGFNAGAVATKTTSGNADLVRGQVGFWSESFSTSTNGTAVNLGAATTSQKIAAALHLYDITGTSTFTFAATVQSAASSAASSSQWTNRFTFSTFSTKGSTFISSTGNITDTWWRFTHATVSSSQSGIGAAGVFGIY